MDHRSIGVNFNSAGQATVLLWAPYAKHKAELVLINEHTKLELKQESMGYWSLQTSEIKPGDEYLFMLDGEKQLPDVASLSQPNGVHGNSQAFDVNAFEWSEQQWQSPELEDYLFYEIHVGTFTPEGTFDAMIEKLDHLVELGITAVELMPLSQFSGGRNWGYDGVFPFAVQNSYGGAAGLQRLVNACHQKGLAVVLDVVYNHLGPEGNYLGEFGPYFTDKYQTPWGNALNFDDAFCDEVRQYFIENVLMWFRDFHIDALRMDAVHAIRDFSAKHLLREIRENVDALETQTGKKHYLGVECDLNDTRYINPAAEGGYAMSAQWSDEFHHTLRVAAGEPLTGYYSDFNGVGHLAKAYLDGYVYTGQYSPHRQKRFGSEIVNNPGEQFVVFSQNHDQVGNRMLGERSSQLFSFEMQKLMVGAVLISPYLPMLFMGEEWSESNPFLYFTSHEDRKLADAVRKGRKAEFKAFHSEGEAPDPQAEKTFEDSKLQWELLSKAPNHAMFEYYKALIALRKSLPALNTLNRKEIKTECNEDDKTLIVYRWFVDQAAACLMNFSGEIKTIEMTADVAHWQKVFDSADPQWNGPASSPERLDKGSSITLQPASIIIYKKIYV